MIKNLQIGLSVCSACALTVALPALVVAQEATQSDIDTNSENVEVAQPLSEIDLQLLAAASGKNKGEIRDFLKQGANIDVVDEYGRTPLLVAIQNSPKSSIAKFLIREGANVNVEDAQGNTAMHYAVKSSAGTAPNKIVNSSSIIKALLEAGASPNQQNNAEQTPREFLLDQTLVAETFNMFSDPESERRSRLGALEDGMIDQGLLQARTYRSQRITLGGILATALTGQIGGGVNQVTQRRPVPRSNSAQRTARKSVTSTPIKCSQPVFENLTQAEGSAIIYAINQDSRLQNRQRGRHCIQKVIATSKVPFRGNTLIKYRIYRLYPNGYRTKCLRPVPDQNRNYWDYFEHTSQCNALTDRTNGKPIEAGGVRYEDGETTI